jgi:hypothetical protein
MHPPTLSAPPCPSMHLTVPYALQEGGFMMESAKYAAIDAIRKTSGLPLSKAEDEAAAFVQDLYLAPSLLGAEAGLGLFTKAGISKGTCFTQYDGARVSKLSAAELRKHDPTRLSHARTAGDGTVILGCQAVMPDMGLGSFANHCPAQQNAEFADVQVAPHHHLVFLKSLHDIKPAGEVYVTYGNQYWL